MLGKWHVSYTCNSSVLIQIGTESLRNKRIFIYIEAGLKVIMIPLDCMENENLLLLLEKCKVGYRVMRVIVSHKTQMLPN